MRLSSDGELIVSGHENGTVQRWRARIGEAVGQQIRAHNSWINVVAVSDDGNRILSCSRHGDVHLWDVSISGTTGIRLREHGGSVTCAAISIDGKLALSGSVYAMARQWDVSAEINVTEQHLSSTLAHGMRSYFCRKSIFSVSVCANR